MKKRLIRTSLAGVRGSSNFSLSDDSPPVVGNDNLFEDYAMLVVDQMSGDQLSEKSNSRTEQTKLSTGTVAETSSTVSSSSSSNINCSSSAVKRGGSLLSTGGGAAKQHRRSDFPAVVSHNKAASDSALDAGARELALNELIRDYHSNSARKPREAKLSTWIKFHMEWPELRDTPPFPLTPETIVKVSASFKARQYRSFKNYLYRAKEEHIAMGFVWSDLLQATITKCKRSVQRGLGSAKQAGEIRLNEICGRRSKLPNVTGGPVNPTSTFILAACFVLRELEVAYAKISHVDINHDTKTVSWRLPVSKTDYKAVGCTRKWGCLCQPEMKKHFGLSNEKELCPYHLMTEHIYYLRDKFLASDDSPLFPNASGEVVAKDRMVDSFEKLFVDCGGNPKNVDGSRYIGGHSARVSGARHWTRLGLDLTSVQLIGRWGSSTILRYVAEVPLEPVMEKVKSLIKSNAADLDLVSGEHNRGAEITQRSILDDHIKVAVPRAEITQRSILDDHIQECCPQRVGLDEHIKTAESREQHFTSARSAEITPLNDRGCAEITLRNTAGECAEITLLDTPENKSSTLPDVTDLRCAEITLRNTAGECAEITLRNTPENKRSTLLEMTENHLTKEMRRMTNALEEAKSFMTSRGIDFIQNSKSNVIHLPADLSLYKPTSWRTRCKWRFLRSDEAVVISGAMPQGVRCKVCFKLEVPESSDSDSTSSSSSAEAEQ